MKKPQSPCLGCKDRNEECHRICEKYLQFEKDNAKFHDIVSQNKLEENYGLSLLTLRNDKQKKVKKF